MADTRVVSEVSPKGEIGDQYGSDMNSANQDLARVGADCNGIKHVADDDDDEVNAGGGDVPGGSYVFVSGTGVLAGDPVKKDLNADDSNLVPNDATVKVGELDVDNAKIALSPVEDGNCIVVGGADVVTSNQDEALPSKTEVPAAADTAEEPNGAVVSEPEPQQLGCVLKVEDPIELHSIEESHTAVVESTPDLEEGVEVMILSTEVGESLGANLKSDQSNDLDSIADLGHSEKCQNGVLEAAECKSSEVEVGEVKSEVPDNLDSIPELGQSEKCQNLVFEATECESSAVEVGGVNSEEQTELKLASEKVERPESQILPLESGLNQLDNGEVKSEEQTQLNSASEVVDCPESEIISSESVESGLHQLGNGEENPVEESPESQIITLESGLNQFDNGEVKSEEQTQLNSASEVVDCPESEIISSESVESGLHQLGNGEENPAEVRTSPDLAIDDSAREIKDNLDFQTAIAKSVDYGEERVEEKKTTDLEIDVEGNELSKIVFTDTILGDEAAKVAEETDVPLEAGNARDIVSYEKQEVSETEASECIDSSKKCPENELPENAGSLCSLTNCAMYESELGDLPTESGQSFPVDPSDDDTAVEQDVGYGAPLIAEKISTCGAAEDTKCETGVENLDIENNASDVKSEVVVKNDPAGEDEPSSSPANQTSSETKIVFGSINHEEEVPTLESDVNMKSETSNGDIECLGGESVAANSLDSDHHIYESLQNGSCADVKPESKVENRSGMSSRDLHTNDATAGSEILDLSAVNSESAPKSVPDIMDAKIMGDQVNGGDGDTENKLLCQESENIVGMHIDEPANLAGSSSVINVESALNSVLEIGDVENGGDQVNRGKCQEMEDGAEIPTCLVGSSSVESVPSVTEIVGVENGGVDQVNGATTDNGLTCQETNDNDTTSLPEGSGADAMMDGQNMEAEAVARPFQFLIRIPRFDDEKLKEQIRHAKLRVEEKTQLRDNIRMEVQVKRANCQAHGDMYEVAKSEERAARRLVRLKRQEIDSAQSVINKVKNAMSVDDIDSRIYNMEHMIEHETLPLKEEKQFIREIKQLRHLREQLSSNMGSMDEVQQAMDQKDEIEERLKILKKELDSLKDKVSKAEVAANAAGKKCDDEGMKLRELQAQFRAADDIRQEAYTHFLSLKRQLFEKNKHFWNYKDDIKASNDYVSRRDRVGLHRLCVNQVEKVMELWNKNDEFRSEYVRCNMRSTVRRLRTLDGRSLGPDEEPPVMASYVNERVFVDRSVLSNPGKANLVSLVSTPSQQGKQVVSPVQSEEAEGRGGKSMTDKLALEQNNPTPKTEKIVKPALVDGGQATTVSGRRDGEAKETKEEEESNMHKKTKEEEEELVKEKAAEEMRKVDLEAKLKEQRRLEEKAKAQEALERKKRNAEKAQIRAALKAQKEAEQKEKEREKRLKKKERKKTGVEGGQEEGAETGGQTTEVKPGEANSKESEIKESNGTTTTSSSSKRAPAPYFRKQSKLKSIPPPPIRNRGSAKKRMQQVIWLLIVAVLIIALFAFGSSGFFVSLRLQQRNGA